MSSQGAEGAFCPEFAGPFATRRLALADCDICRTHCFHGLVQGMHPCRDASSEGCSLGKSVVVG